MEILRNSQILFFHFNRITFWIILEALLNSHEKFFKNRNFREIEISKTRKVLSDHFNRFRFWIILETVLISHEKLKKETFEKLRYRKILKILSVYLNHITF